MHHGIGHMVTGGRWSGPGCGSQAKGDEVTSPPGKHPPGTTVNVPAVCILLECNLVRYL